MNEAQAKMLYRAREMIKLLNVYLNHFPKHEKYGLAQEIRRTAYDWEEGVSHDVYKTKRDALLEIRDCWDDLKEIASIDKMLEEV